MLKQQLYGVTSLSGGNGSSELPVLRQQNGSDLGMVNPTCINSSGYHSRIQHSPLGRWHLKQLVKGKSTATGQAVPIKRTINNSTGVTVGSGHGPKYTTSCRPFTHRTIASIPNAFCRLVPCPASQSFRDIKSGTKLSSAHPACSGFMDHSRFQTISRVNLGKTMTGPVTRPVSKWSGCNV